jgi:uncharacterized protein (UPF0335 family)
LSKERHKSKQDVNSELEKIEYLEEEKLKILRDVKDKLVD